MTAFLESLWFLVAYPLLLAMSIALGFYIAKKQFTDRNKTWKSSGTENAVIGFYALLLSFSLYSSGNAYRERANLVHQHADALGSIFREAQLSNDTIRSGVTAWVKGVLAAKIKYREPQSKRQILREETTDSLYDVFMTQVKAMETRGLSTAAQRFYIDKLNTAIALDYRIRYMGVERTPTVVIVLLILGSFLVGLLIGFTNGATEHPHFLVPAIFFLLTTLTISTILDMDNPSFGIIRPSYNNYSNMLEVIGSGSV